ncbi:hypothetical protein GQX74_013373 [Glossina fuscipes]|nr:hypothetical protein GQX74_013373 [Glossina fuscipes]
MLVLESTIFVSEDLFINSANLLPTSNLMKASCSLIAVSPSVAADEELAEEGDEEEDDLPRNTTQTGASPLRGKAYAILLRYACFISQAIKRKDSPSIALFAKPSPPNK